MHDIISDIIDWDQANKAYTAGEGHLGELYMRRLEAAVQMAEIDARWQHLPGGFHGERKLIKVHIRAVAETTQAARPEELCWLAIAAASAWLPKPAPAETTSPQSVQEGHPNGVALLLLMGNFRAERTAAGQACRFCHESCSEAAANFVSDMTAKA